MTLTPEQERRIVARHAHSIMRELEAYARTQIDGVRSLRVSVAAAVYMNEATGVLTEQPAAYAIEAWIGSFGVRYIGRGAEFDAALQDCLQNISEGKHA